MAPGYGLWIFCIAQLAHSLVMIAVYYGAFARELANGAVLPMASVAGFFPRGVGGRPWYAARLTGGGGGGGGGAAAARANGGLLMLP